jgi:hypothetical protein
MTCTPLTNPARLPEPSPWKTGTPWLPAPGIALKSSRHTLADPGPSRAVGAMGSILGFIHVGEDGSTADYGPEVSSRNDELASLKLNRQAFGPSCPPPRPACDPPPDASSSSPRISVKAAGSRPGRPEWRNIQPTCAAPNGTRSARFLPGGRAEVNGTELAIRASRITLEPVAARCLSRALRRRPGGRQAWHGPQDQARCRIT